MFKISVIDGSAERRLVVEGRLAAGSVRELKTALKAAKQDLNGHELVVDLKNVIAISEEGESVILELMNDGATVAWVTQRTTETSRHQATAPPPAVPD